MAVKMRLSQRIALRCRRKHETGLQRTEGTLTIIKRSYIKSARVANHERTGAN